MQVSLVPCLTDNYAYIINDNDSKTVGVVDPSEASPIIACLKRLNLKLDYILNTHHHFDRIPGLDIKVEDNMKWFFGNSSVKILHIPGHTLGHICFFFEKEKIAFTGDTLFSLGCGRIFEGDHKQMLRSLNKIKKLPKSTKIYCGHEYSYKNGEFCIKYDSNNNDLKKKFEKIKQLRSNNLPTLPTILAEELRSNIFLRCDQNDLKGKFDMKNEDDYKVFTKIRDLKDNF